MSTPQPADPDVTRLIEQSRQQSEQLRQAQNAYNQTADHLMKLAEMIRDDAQTRSNP